MVFRLAVDMEKLTPDFFTADPVECARNLIGASFHWKGCAGRVVETEAYHAIGDEACHTWLRPSSRDFIKNHRAGDAYVYLNYGVHWLFNILVKGRRGNGFVLIRALEPLEGLTVMRKRRGDLPEKILAAGPGRLTSALGIGREDHGTPFLKSERTWIQHGEESQVITGPRIGISRAVELPWRFGDPESKCLSKRF